MPSSSYIRQNDYRPQEFRPYELPYNAVMQAAQVREAYFKQNVAQMQQQWSRITGLNPLNINNRQYLKDFETQALKKFQKVAKSDLTVQGNQALFSQIVDPLYDTTNETNANLLRDHDLNKHFQEQAQASQRARTTDGGKSWSQDNDFYWQKEYEAYQKWATSGGDPSQVNNFKKKSFIPYYNYSKELNDISKNCATGGFKNIVPESTDSPYMITQSSIGANSAEMAECIRLGLSPQAQQQIALKGYRTYYYDREQLANDFETNRFGTSKKMLNKLETQLASFQLKKSLTEEEKQAKALLEAQLPQLKTQYDEARSIFEKKINGTLQQYIDENYEDIAGSTYFATISTQLGAARATEINEIKYQADPFKLQMLKHQQEIEFATQIRYPHEERMKMMELNNSIMKDFLSGKSSGKIPKNGRLERGEDGIYRVVVDPVEQLRNVREQDLTGQQTYEHLIRQKDMYTAKADNDLRNLQAGVRDVLGNNVTDQQLTPEALEQTVATVMSANPATLSSKGTTIKRLYDEYVASKTAKEHLTSIYNATEAMMKPFYDDFNKDPRLNEKIFTGPFGSPLDELNLTYRDLIALSEPDVTEYKGVYKRPIGSKSTGFLEKVDDALWKLYGSENEYYIIKDGKEVIVTGAISYVKNVYGPNTYNKLQAKKAKIIEENRNKIYGDLKLLEKKFELPTTDQKELESFAGERIRGLTGIVGAYGEKDGYHITHRYADGSAGVQFRDENGKIKKINSDILEQVRSVPGGSKIDNNTVRIPGLFDPIDLDFSGRDHQLIADVVRSNERLISTRLSEEGISNITASKYKGPSTEIIKPSVFKTPKGSTVIVDYVKEGNQTIYRLYREGHPDTYFEYRTPEEVAGAIKLR